MITEYKRYMCSARVLKQNTENFVRICLKLVTVYLTNFVTNNCVSTMDSIQ